MNTIIIRAWMVVNQRLPVSLAVMDQAKFLHLVRLDNASLRPLRSGMKKFASYAALTIVFVWFMFGGISHFTNPDFFVAIMPPYVPWHLGVVYLSGALEILFAAMLLVPATRQLAGNLLIALTLAVTPANIHMWLNPHLFPEIEPVFLSIRLVVQVILLVLIWWSTRDVRWQRTEIIERLPG
jgi:uncharacterized membrane protein